MNFEPAWLAIARRMLGTAEYKGVGESNKIIEDFHAATKGGPATDDVPWCSSFLCYIFKSLSLDNPRSKSSQAWLAWGIDCNGPIVGAVGIISRPGGKGHVGLVCGVTPTGRVLLLGGNQSDQVCVKSFDRDSFAAFRYPEPPIRPDPGPAGSTV